MPPLLRIATLVLALLCVRNGYAQEDLPSPTPALRISSAGGLLVAGGAADDMQQVCGTIGIRGGLMFNQRLMLGAQLSATSTTFTGSGTIAATDERTLQVNENGLWAQYAVTRSRTIQPFVGLQLGWGKATWTRTGAARDNGTRPGGDAQVLRGISVISPSIGVHFNCGTWFRPDLVLGYHVVDGIELNALSSTVMNGPFIGIHAMFGGFRP
ncbi:MAG: hypothetical protein MUE88_02975 [Flavobacteriales bacterium]|nr:hypothetical protein [Flavobacteriales bacterium]